MATMKENVAKLLALRFVITKDEFPKNPSGYNQRTNATLIQLCCHADPVVREACATSPLLRDMFVIAMFETEDNEAVKAVLEPRYLEAVSKDHMRDTIIAEKDAEIVSLKAALAKRNRKTTRK